MNSQNKKINHLYIIALCVKIGLIIAAIVLTNAGLFNPASDYLKFTNLCPESIYKIFFNNDSGFYNNIADYGYRDLPAELRAQWTHPELHFAFFPLYPFCVGFVMQLTGGSFFACAFWFNILLLYLVVRYFYLFVLQVTASEQTSFRTVLLLLFFPFSMHLFFDYTEAIYFILLIASFYHLSKRQWVAFAIASGLVVLTRPNGILLALPFAFYILENDQLLSLKGIAKAFTKPYYYLLLVMPLVFGLWLCYQYSVTGNYFAFTKAQASWNKQTMFPLLAFFRNGFWEDKFSSIYTILIMLAAIYWAKKWSVSYNVLVWAGLLLPLSAGSVASMTRYISVLFPFTLQFGMLKFANQYFKWILMVFVLLQLVCLKLWLESVSLMY